MVLRHGVMFLARVLKESLRLFQIRRHLLVVKQVSRVINLTTLVDARLLVSLSVRDSTSIRLIVLVATDERVCISDTHLRGELSLRRIANDYLFVSSSVLVWSHRG